MAQEDGLKLTKKKRNEFKEDLGCLCWCALVTIAVLLLAAILAWWVATGY